MEIAVYNRISTNVSKLYIARVNNICENYRIIVDGEAITDV